MRALFFSLSILEWLKILAVGLVLVGVCGEVLASLKDDKRGSWRAVLVVGLAMQLAFIPWDLRETAMLRKETEVLKASNNRLYKAAIARGVTPDLQRRFGDIPGGSATILYVAHDEEARHVAGEFQDSLRSFGWTIKEFREMTAEEHDWAPLIGSHLTTSRTDPGGLTNRSPRVELFREILGAGPGSYANSALADNSFIVKIGHNKAILWDWSP